MSKAGDKMLAGARAALAAARCDHEWERVSSMVEEGQVIRTVDYCEKCGSRKTSTPKSQWTSHQ